MARSEKNQFCRLVNVTKIPCILQEELILEIRDRYFKLALLRLVKSLCYLIFMYECFVGSFLDHK